MLWITSCWECRVHSLLLCHLIHDLKHTRHYTVLIKLNENNDIVCPVDVTPLLFMTRSRRGVSLLCSNRWSQCMISNVLSILTLYHLTAQRLCMEQRDSLCPISMTVGGVGVLPNPNPKSGPWIHRAGAPTQPLQLPASSDGQLSRKQSSLSRTSKRSSSSKM